MSPVFLNIFHNEASTWLITSENYFGNREKILNLLKVHLFDAYIFVYNCTIGT